jgi:hypothetical protein
LVLQIDRNQAYTLSRSVAVHDSDALLVWLPKLHPGRLPADQMVNPPIIGQLEHNEVGQVPQTCSHTLAEIGGWTHDSGALRFSTTSRN